MPPRQTWTMGEAKEMRRWYETGMSLREVGEQFGYEKTTTGRAVQAAGGTLREPGFNARQKALARDTRRKTRMTQAEGMPPEQETLGQRIRRLRLAKGMTQRELSNILEVHSGYFSRLEGDSRPIREHMVAAIASALGITVEELTEGVREVSIPKQSEHKRTAAAAQEPVGEFVEDVPADDTDLTADEVGVLFDRGEPIEVVTAPPPEDGGPLLEEAEQPMLSVLCFNGDHDRCHAEWCKCPHHSRHLRDWLSQEAVEAEAVAEREEDLYQAEREYDVRLSIASYLRREALHLDSRLVKAYVTALADEIIAGRDKRQS